MPVPRHTSEKRASDLSETRLTPVQSLKSHRVLACVLCQQRKVKCDRKFPCASCIKSRVQCVPATKVSRRRRRRFSEQELLERLGKYERLLCENNIEFEPLHGAAVQKKESSKEQCGSGSDYEQSRIVGTDNLSPATAAGSKGLYENKNILRTINQQFRDFNSCSDSSEDDLPPNKFKNAWELMFENDDHLLFGSRKTMVDISSLHPDPAQIFRLWQLYLENINPLLKVTHTPSLQGRLIEAAGDISNICPTLEALMFSIYCMAILSLAVDECQSIFGSLKVELLNCYQFGCQQALINSGFLRNDDRDCLTALYLYLVSARSRSNPQSLSSLLGVAIRIAQRMGIHSESALSKCSLFEAEMCRRLWWSLILFDTRIGEIADSKTASLTPIWDCKVPLNVNDSDLRPEMKQLPNVRAKSSDTIFAVVRSELGEFIRHSIFHLGFNCPALIPSIKGSQQRLASQGSKVFTLEKTIEDQYLQFCDPENPLHLMTIWTTRGHLAKCRFLEHHLKCSDSCFPQSEEQRDAALSYAISMLECDTNIMSSPLTKQFHWLSHSYFPFTAYIQIVQHLKRDPVNKQAEHAWDVMSENFEPRFRLVRGEDVPCFAIFSNTVLQAWKAREATVKESALAFVTPKIVSSMRNKLAQMVPSAQEITKKVTNDVTSVGYTVLGEPILTPSDYQFPAYSIGTHDDIAMTNVESYRELYGPNPLDGSLNQLDWSVMDWNLMNAAAIGADEPTVQACQYQNSTDSTRQAPAALHSQVDFGNPLSF